MSTLRRMRNIFLFFFLILVSFGRSSLIDSINQANATELTEKAFVVLDSVEHGVSTAWKWTESHRQIVKAAGGFVLLFYGGQFTNTMLFIHALAVAGGPALSKSFQELLTTYQNTRVALKEELPHLVKAKDDVVALKAQVSAYKAQIDSATEALNKGSITQKDFERQSETAKKAIAELQNSLQKISAVQNSFSHLKAAVNPRHLQEIGVAIYQTFVMGIAAVSSQAVATMTMGLNMGKVAFDRMFKIFALYTSTHHSAITDAASNFVDTNPEWIQTGGKLFAKTLGVGIAFVMDKATNVFSACSMGSSMIVNSVEELVDPILVQLGLPTLESTPHGVAVLQTALIAIGYRSQIFNVGSSLPTILKIVLSPLIAFEAFLSGLVFKKGLF